MDATGADLVKRSQASVALIAFFAAEYHARLTGVWQVNDSPIHFAARGGHAATVEALLKARADPRAVNAVCPQNHLPSRKDMRGAEVCRMGRE